jgi:adenosylmethionine-8-amino-7-oxononanoate aminotransferase
LLEEAIVREGADTVAAFIAEPIHGGGGVLYPTDDYFPLVRQVCDKHNVLFIADEVITGFCRTGKWFALEHWNVLPDIVSFAKGVSSGYLPLGGIMVSKAIKQAMDDVKPEDKWMHAYTYSGHPTCCAVGIKNLEIMERERLWERAAAMGTRLHKGLQQALGDHKHVGDIRGGKGLLAAVELVEDRGTKAPFGADKKVGPRVLAEMTKRGVITRARLEHIFFAPPLVVSEEQVDRLVSVLRDSIKVVTGVGSLVPLARSPPGEGAGGAGVYDHARRDHARAARAHLLRAAAGGERGAGRPPRLGAPRLPQGRHRRLIPAAYPSPPPGERAG